MLTSRDRTSRCRARSAVFQLHAGAPAHALGLHLYSEALQAHEVPVTSAGSRRGYFLSQKLEVLPSTLPAIKSSLF